MGINYQELRLKEEQTINNKATRMLLCICVDASYSMSGSKIKKVNEEVDKFFRTMNANTLARDSVEVCLIAFGDTVEVKCNFGHISDAIVANKEIRANGKLTSLGEAVRTGLSMLDLEIASLNAGGNKYNKPWLIIISDGEATDTDLCKKMSKEVKQRQEKGALKVKCLSVGDKDETKSLRAFSSYDEVEQIDKIDEMEFFTMLSRSISKLSSSSIQYGDFL